MNGQRNGPMSPPESIGGGDWSGNPKYSNTDSDPYAQQSPNNRGQLASPPISSGSNSMAMNNGGGFPRRGSSGGNPGGPSPPASIARSSTGMYAQSESGRSRKDEQFEAALSEHYVALKRYLAASLRDEKGNPRPNRARDKLLRLSPVQFQELSTDVFDELQRRQQAGRRPMPGAPEQPPTPEFLLPKDSFHPKRNQARQKLSTLPPPRFRDLATDVFYELERRFPRFVGGDISRMGSPASSMRGPPSRNGTPVNGLPGGPRIRRPSEATSVSGFSVRSESRNGSRGPLQNMNGGGPISPGATNEFGRPQPKTFQSNTIVPNKSTMVEDDETGGEDDDDDGDAFGLESAARSRSSKKSGTSDTDKKLIDDYQSQVAELREKLDTMEDNLKQKDDELNNVLDGERTRASASNLERQEWVELRKSLEDKLQDAQNLNESLQAELDRLRSSHADTEMDLRNQIDGLRTSQSTRGGGNSQLERENEELRTELREQEILTDEVRREAQQSLREMRMLSEQSPVSHAREEQLSNTVSQLEEEVKDWRNRYARTKTQLRNLRASSIGLTIQQDAVKYAKESGFTQDDGLVKDVHITKFQISIDELLQVARVDNPERAMDFMKSVVVNVRQIVQDIDEAGGELGPQQIKLKSRVSTTTNNLITATKNHASARGLAPVSLLDAAASHLTSAIVELVRTVKVRPTPAGELEDDDDGNITPQDNTGYFPVRDLRPDSTNPPPFRGFGRMSGESSMYSNSPRASMDMRARDSGKESWAGRLRSQSKVEFNGTNGINGNKQLPLPPMGVGFGIRTQDNDVEDLKIYLDDQTALLVSTIQTLVSSIRSESGIATLTNSISSVSSILTSIITSTETTMSSTGNALLRVQAEPIIRKLDSCKSRLQNASDKGREIAGEGRDDDQGDREWRAWCGSIPPIAFEIARETKELVVRVDGIYEKRGDESEDFS